MKRTKAEPNFLGLFLVVAGLLLLSMAMLNLGSTATNTTSSGVATLALGGTGLIALLAGAYFSSRKKA